MSTSDKNFKGGFFEIDQPVNLTKSAIKNQNYSHDSLKIYE